LFFIFLALWFCKNFTGFKNPWIKSGVLGYAQFLIDANPGPCAVWCMVMGP